MSHKYRTFVDFIAITILEFKYPNTFEKRWDRMSWDSKEGWRADARVLIGFIAHRPWEAAEDDQAANCSPESRLILAVADLRRDHLTIEAAKYVTAIEGIKPQ